MTEQDQQLRDRHKLPEALDRLRDAVTETGPGEDEHERVLEQLAARQPRVAALLLRLVSLRTQDDTSDVTEDSPAGRLVVKLVGDDAQGDKLVRFLSEQNANVLLHAYVGLGVASRLAGLTTWQAPDES